ncbi:MAG: OmpH family outer membrane protein [Gammaproteobacteria bacterium]|nr:OmpH family outer membrane protein [Gammaproteobacteria bacterium]
MKKFLLFLLPAIFFNNAAYAAESLAIGYVDLHKVLLESKVGKKNKAELDKLIKEKETAIGKEEEKLKAMQQAFEKDQMLLTDVQKKTKQKEFQEKAEAYQKMVNEAKQTVNQKDGEYAGKSIAEVKRIITEMTKEQKLNIVFEASESGLLYADPSMDLTQKVIERYDALSSK